MHQKGAGCLEIRSRLGVPVYLHWSFPVGGVMVCGFFGGSLGQMAYYIICFSLLVLVHEIGHLLAARIFNLKVVGIKISGAGGMCYCDIPRTYAAAFALFSGGLIAQAIAFFVTVGYIEIFDYPANRFGNSFVLTFTAANIVMFLASLFPLKSTGGVVTDGYFLWNTFRQWYQQA